MKKKADWDNIQYIHSMKGILDNLIDKGEEYINKGNRQHLQFATSYLQSFRSEIEQAESSQYWKEKEASSDKQTKTAGGQGRLSEDTSDVLEAVVIQNITLSSSAIWQLVKSNQWLYERLMRETGGDEELIIRYIDENIDMYQSAIDKRISKAIDLKIIEAKKKEFEHSPKEEGFMEECMRKHKDKKDPGAYCAAIIDRAKGTTDWRKGPRKKKD